MIKAAEWVTGSHHCDICGDGPFHRPSRLLSHRLGKICRNTVFTRYLSRRPDNIRRTIRENLADLRGFVKTTVAKQRATPRRACIRFMPFGYVPNYTHDAGCILRKSLAMCPRSRPLATQLAAVAAIAQLWTDRWAHILRAVPAPASPRYKRALRKRLAHAARRRQQVCNVAIRGCCSKSMLGLSKRCVDKKANTCPYIWVLFFCLGSRDLRDRLPVYFSVNICSIEMGLVNKGVLLCSAGDAVDRLRRCCVEAGGGCGIFA